MANRMCGPIGLLIVRMTSTFDGSCQVKKNSRTNTTSPFTGKEHLFVRLRISNGKLLGTRGWANWRLVIMNLPEELEEKKPEIIAHLKAALEVYKDFGVYSTMIEYTASFEF